ncbi:SpaA isopeptide-forming pilin-related protein [Blautia sp. AF26-2]|uniref:SpaA isopeptide-forming pilin-related protein n=1 Tax=Blautia sp. AF26-2 TaxID=2292966 RepID=UPI000E524CDB|nr:SpaA isopeptide-forming pilin-related protein [Blautia sp. AF26-2]RGG18489.1 peptidase [Blautia sp. AF26-2]
MKMRFKRFLSGFMAVATLASVIIQPVAVSASELEPEEIPFEQQYAELKDVQDSLDPDEIVKANDIELSYGQEFDVEVDLSGIEGVDESKIKVLFHEAKNEAGTDFDTHTPDTYKAVYAVEPVSDHPAYRISRNITVKEPETEVQSEHSSESAVNIDDDTGDSEQSEEDSESHREIQNPENTVEPESELTVSEALEQAESNGIDLYAMNEGETVTFMAAAGNARSSQQVSVTRGAEYRYADYGYGTYLTYQYTVKFGNISATAYCVQPSKPGPGSGTYTINKVGDGKALAKVCYYGTKASGDDGFFTEENGYGNLSTGARFILVHLAASYANGSGDAFSGANSTAQNLAMKLYNYCISQPEIPDVAMSFSDADVKAYVDGNSQRTKDITFNADALQTITMKLPAGVQLHNLTTGKTSKAGESVEISGGTKFYLSAPLTQVSDVAGSWSATMKGSITKDYSAYKISTGSGNQDLALVFGEGVDDEKYVDFKVSWVQQASVKVIKKDAKSDAKLAGAVFGLYSDAECTKLITKLPATDENGEASVQITKTQDTVYLKEITAPSGYRINATAYNVKLEVSKTTTVTVPDEEQMGQLTVYKEGEVLVGADVTENGTTFKYEKRRQNGAVYNVYAGADIKTAYGTKVYSKGDLVKENLTTDTNGATVLKNLYLGTYIVKEKQAPTGFYNGGEEKTVTLSYAGQNVDVVFSETTFTNDRQKVEVMVTKQDEDTENPLDGGIFGLYAASDITNVDGTVIVKKGTLIQKATTGADGTTKFTADLPLGFSYDVKEVQAPEGYVRNIDDVYTFAFSYTNDKEAKQTFKHTFKNERVTAKISLQKQDKETKKAVPQGDATLEKAVYGLYAREDIVHPDGATGVIYKAGEQVATLTTDKNGQASVNGLYLGNYYAKEITPPTGYLADEEEHDLVCNYGGDLVAEVNRECLSLEQVMKQPFQIIKAANNGKTDADLLKGAGFTAYLVSSLKVKEDGSYDFDSAKPVVIGENGATEIFTDEKGYACSIAIPYGTYIVRETTTPHNYTPVDDFTVRITENNPNQPQTWRVLLDDEFEAKLKIIKQDDETKKPVLQKNTEFKIYDLDHKKYVEQVTTYPTTVKHKSYFTDEQGYLILPQNLKIGNYRIEEVNAPFGYTLNENYYEVTVDSNTAYQMDGTSGDVIIEAVYENHPVKGELTIVKKGEVLDGFKDDFTYQTENLEGAEFEIYAAEDIYTADFQKDDNGNRILEYAAGTLVKTVTTDKDGKAVLKNLPLGSYKIVEKTAPDGFVLNGEAQTITFSYKDQETPVIEQTATFENERQKVEISVVKQDADTEKAVAGAEFGLYAKNDMEAHGTVIVKADTLLGKAVSGEDGKAVFTQDLPFGEYYIKELAAPDGYVSSDEVLEVKAEYQGQNIKVVQLSSVFKNQPTKVVVSKSDLTTGVELSGATLTVLDKDGNVVDTWKSVKGEQHLIERLTVGETYTLREEMAPYGYLKAEEITFTLEDTGEIQKVEMKDDVPTGTIIINKNGEFLDKVTALDSVGGWISHLFQYVTGSLKDVTFEVYALEDVKSADGESEDYYKKDELVATITTDDTGIAKISGLPLGKYYVKEKATVDGFVLDDEAREIDLTYRDQDTAEVTYSADWQNNRQKAEVEVVKKEKDSDRVLEGAVFALCAKEDITGTDGKVILKADTVIEELATDKEGKLTFKADLPIGFAYYIKETSPAPGFATTDETQEFTFAYEGAEKEKVSYAFTFEDEPTVIEITKTSLTDGKELEGAKLQVTDESGKVVDSWTSGKEAHIIKELVVGQKYTLTETKPADGYVTAESITFTVEDTAKSQKIEMKDDVTKVEISKTDISGKELPGAKLTILDKDGKTVESWTSEEKPHYIEMLPIGEYTLREESAPDGYLVSEDVKFTVKDTGEIQKVVMKDEVKPEETSTPETPSTQVTDTPKTGDDTHMLIWILLAIAGMAGSVSAVWIAKKRK